MKILKPFLFAVVITLTPFALQAQTSQNTLNQLENSTSEIESKMTDMANLESRLATAVNQGADEDELEDLLEDIEDKIEDLEDPIEDLIDAADNTSNQMLKNGSRMLETMCGDLSGCTDDHSSSTTSSRLNYSNQMNAIISDCIRREMQEGNL